MERFVKGEVVVVPFPCSDLSRSKHRPALVVQHFDGEDLLLAQITSQVIRDKYSVELSDSDFKAGSLNKQSNVRPNKLFTCSKILFFIKLEALRKRKCNLLPNQLNNYLISNI